MADHSSVIFLRGKDRRGGELGLSGGCCLGVGAFGVAKSWVSFRCCWVERGGGVSVICWAANTGCFVEGRRAGDGGLADSSSGRGGDCVVAAREFGVAWRGVVHVWQGRRSQKNGFFLVSPPTCCDDSRPLVQHRALNCLHPLVGERIRVLEVCDRGEGALIAPH